MFDERSLRRRNGLNGHDLPLVSHDGIHADQQEPLEKHDMSRFAPFTGVPNEQI